MNFVGHIGKVCDGIRSAVRSAEMSREFLDVILYLQSYRFLWVIREVEGDSNDRRLNRLDRSLKGLRSSQDESHS